MKRLFPLLLVLIYLATLSLFFAAVPNKATALSKSEIVEKRYNLARARHNLIKFSSKWADDRKNWLITAKAFSQSYKSDPYHSLAPNSLLTLGHIYFRMYKRFAFKEDLNEALAYYDDVVSLFPRHRFADDALYKTAKIYAVELNDLKNASLVFAKLVAVYPKGDMITQAAKDLKMLKSGKIPGKKLTPAQNIKLAAVAKLLPEKITAIAEKKKKALSAEVVKLRHWSTESYTRVVIETTSPVNYKGHLLKREGNKPRRLYVNLTTCQISRKLQKAIPVKDGLLQRIRSAQFKPGTVRVVLDTQSLTDYKIFNLNDPYRIVIDVKGLEKPVQPPPTQIVNIPNAPSLAQQLGLGIKRVVLDPGHGGKDPGAIGVGGMREKDVVLKVAKKVARKITKELGIEVTLTRKHDVFLRLEERTAIANTKQGDLFISIHANSAESPKAKGIETYYLDLATNEDEMKIAATENASAAQKISDLQDILKNLMNNSKKAESSRLASLVQTNLYNGLSNKFSRVKNHGVKKAPFIVLIGAQMPSILTEIAFISNPTEAKRLQTDQYLEAIADNLTKGIVEYAVALKMASL